MHEVNIGDYLWLNLYADKGRIVCGHLVDISPNNKLIALSRSPIEEYNLHNKMVDHLWVDLSIVSLIDYRKYTPKEQMGFIKK